MCCHILPDVMPIVWANSVLIVALAVLGEAGLSYFGLGDPDAFSWGTQLYNGFQAGAINAGAWWYDVSSGLAITLFVLAFFAVGQVIEEIVDKGGGAMSDDPVLRVDDLRVGYAWGRRGGDRIGRLVRAAARRGARPGGRVGLRQDHDGAGHAATPRPVLRRLSGTIDLATENGVVHIHRRTERGMRELRWTEISLVFQGALSALNPVQRISRQIGDAVRLHDPDADRTAVRERVQRIARARGHQPGAAASTRTSSRAACASG